MLDASSLMRLHNLPFNIFFQTLCLVVTKILREYINLNMIYIQMFEHIPIRCNRLLFKYCNIGNFDHKPHSISISRNSIFIRRLQVP